MPLGRIDVHGHLLPALDDGSRSVHESLEIARLMANAGYSHLTCSPHIWPGHAYAPAFILERVAALQKIMDSARVPITLIAGGELNIVELDVFAMHDDDIPSYAMAGKHVLFDFWAGDLPDDYWDRVEHLRAIGATPIQAHPERIMAFQDQPELLDELANRGVLLQGNLHCFAETPTSRMRRCAEKWLREGRYFVLGSDLHRVETIPLRLEGLRRAVDVVGNAEIDRLTKTNAAIVANLANVPRASA